MTQILINARFQHVAQASGVQRYAVEVTQRLGPRVRLARPPARGALPGHLWEQAILPIQARAADVLWSPANTGPLAATRQVVTLHDLTALEHPEWYTPAYANWHRRLIPRLARNAAHILTVSQKSRQQIARLQGVSPSKITVVYPGVGPQFQPAAAAHITAVLQKYRLPSPYFLWIGAQGPRKNLERLLTAWEWLRPNHAGIALVLAGAGGILYQGGRGRLPENIYLPGFISQADLPALYSGALALLLPSIFEGFGLPVLEAAACGTPALISRHAGVLEVLDAGWPSVDPFDVTEIADQMERLATDQEWRAHLVHRGAQAAACLSWERCAAAIFSLLISVANGA